MTPGSTPLMTSDTTSAPTRTPSTTRAAPVPPGVALTAVGLAACLTFGRMRR
jgi:hypothetical protein